MLFKYLTMGIFYHRHGQFSNHLLLAVYLYINMIGEAMHSGNRFNVHRAMHIIMFNYPITSGESILFLFHYKCTYTWKSSWVILQIPYIMQSYACNNNNADCVYNIGMQVTTYILLWLKKTTIIIPVSRCFPAALIAAVFATIFYSSG